MHFFGATPAGSSAYVCRVGDVWTCHIGGISPQSRHRVKPGMRMWAVLDALVSDWQPRGLRHTDCVCCAQLALPIRRDPRDRGSGRRAGLRRGEDGARHRARRTGGGNHAALAPRHLILAAQSYIAELDTDEERPYRIDVVAACSSHHRASCSIYATILVPLRWRSSKTCRT